MHAIRRHNAAFSLIELMVVVAIVLTLMGLIIAAGSFWVTKSAKELTTIHRMNQVLSGMDQYTQEGDIVARLQRVGGFDFEFVSLRGAISLLTDTYGNDIRSMERDLHLPPRLGNRWQNAMHRDTLKNLGYGSNAAADWDGLPLNDSTKIDYAMESRGKWPDKGTGIDNVILFYDRQIGMSTHSGKTNSRITANFPQLVKFTEIEPDWWMLEVWDDVTGYAYQGGYGSTLPGMAGSFLTRRGARSALGETLDQTQEVKPDQIRPSSWYLEQWPNLIEVIGPNSLGDPVFSHTTWPESDWDQDAPGSIPVVWPWPWGKQIFSRTEGGLLSQIEYRVDGSGDLINRTLADLNPIKTIPLLQAAGIVAPNDEGAETYRTSRNVDKSWNDAWGSPLIVVNASYLPARYDFDDTNDTMYHQEIGGQIPKMSRDALGGRDFFITKAKDTYGYSRSFYATVGSTGGSHSDLIPSPWSAAEDAATLRNLWLRIREVTNATEWDGTSFDDPPWEGVRSRKQGNFTCHLMPPKEFR